MCYNIIQYREFRCGHYHVIKRQMVDCNGKRCQLSGMHETRKHDCELTACAKEMMPDQGVIDPLDVKCSRCAGGMNGH